MFECFHIFSLYSVDKTVDIDWNNASIPGIDDPITSTGQLLSIIGNVKAAVGNITPSGSGSTDNKSIIQRLSELETAVQALSAMTKFAKLGDRKYDDVVDKITDVDKDAVQAIFEKVKESSN